MGVCEEKIFKQLYFRWNVPLQRFIQSKGLAIDQSADLVQESFLRLWKGCAKVSMEKAKSFLFTVANNLFIDEYRKQQTRMKLKALPVKDKTLEDGQFDVEMNEFREQLEAAIQSMTPASREVFVLHRFNEMSYKEIAELLAISVKAVEKRMGKALRHLAAKMIRLKR